jgi:hypothetical protein
MRDYRDAKAMAQTLRSALAARNLKLSTGESLELIAKLLGFADWNTLAAAIKAAPKDETPRDAETAPKTEAPPDPKAVVEDVLANLAASLGPRGWDQLLVTIRTHAAATGAKPPIAPNDLAQASPRRTGQFFIEALEATLHRAVEFAVTRKHQYTTLEHLLMALTTDPDAVAVMDACQVDLPQLQASLTKYLDEDLKPLVKPDIENSGPTAGFHRVVQRAVIHVQSSGRSGVTGANILVAVFSEQESHAAFFLQQQKMTRFDAVNFIAHGIRKGDAAA